MRNLRTILLAAVAATAAFGLGTGRVAYASGVVVTPDNMGNWAFDNRDINGIVGANATGSGGMVTGPATPPLGVGSANLSTGNGTIGGDGAEELRNTAYNGIALSSLTSLTYSTYMVTNNGQQFPYLALMISTTGVPNTQDDILFFEPPYQTHASGNPGLPDQGPTQLNTWQTWDALAGGWWDNNSVGTAGTGVVSLSTIEAAYPNATIENPVSGLGAVRFDVGFASPGDQFNGNVDNFTIGTADGTTTFDFEPSVPEPASLALLGAGLAGLGVVRRRRKAA
jgi:hypothetical protein